MKTALLKKVPWKGVLKTFGVVAIGVASAMGAYETDAKVQTAIKKVAEKSLEAMEKKS